MFYAIIIYIKKRVNLMKMNISFIKQMSLFCALIGAVVGIIALIPYVGGVVFITFYTLLAAIIIIYLKKINILDELTIKEGAILGAIIGTGGTAGFLCVYCPLIMLSHMIFGNDWIGPMLISCFSSFLSLFCLIFMLIFVIMLSALMNSFSGAVTIYLFEVLKKLNDEQ